MTRRCHLCRATTGLEQGKHDPAMWWCRQPIDCTYRARRRLGIPEWQARRLRAREWSEAVEKPARRAA